jgi:hypothetical protein
MHSISYVNSPDSPPLRDPTPARGQTITLPSPVLGLGGLSHRSPLPAPRSPLTARRSPLTAHRSPLADSPLHGLDGLDGLHKAKWPINPCQPLTTGPTATTFRPMIAKRDPVGFTDPRTGGETETLRFAPPMASRYYPGRQLHGRRPRTDTLTVRRPSLQPPLGQSDQIKPNQTKSNQIKP